MNLGLKLNNEWDLWENEIKDFLPSSAERRKTLLRIVESANELASLCQSIEQNTKVTQPSDRYFGLDALKLMALNMARSIEDNIAHLSKAYLQHTNHRIMGNILQNRLAPKVWKSFQMEFKPLELYNFAIQQAQLDAKEEAIGEARHRLHQEIDKLHEDYEIYLFAESSFDAARSFGTMKPDIRMHRSSWLAFSKLLCGIALQIQDEDKIFLQKKTRRLEAQREALFERCSQLLKKKEESKHVKNLHRQIRHYIIELKRLEDEIDSTLKELSIPSINDHASFVVKKNPEQVTTSERPNISQSTGDKT